MPGRHIGAETAPAGLGKKLCSCIESVHARCRHARDLGRRTTGPVIPATNHLDSKSKRSLPRLFPSELGRLGQPFGNMSETGANQYGISGCWRPESFVSVRNPPLHVVSCHVSSTASFSFYSLAVSPAAAHWCSDGVLMLSMCFLHALETAHMRTHDSSRR